MSKIRVNTRFDAGSIEVVDITKAQDLRFKIRNDTNSHFAQWFYFQLSGIKDTPLKISIGELSKTAYPAGWENYDVCVSYDNQDWFRLSSTVVNDSLCFNITPEANSIYFAYFEPYSYSRHLELVGYANQSDLARHEVLGGTVEGRNMDLLVVGDESGSKRKIWVTARQHPGETMAEWFMEGLTHRLLNLDDAVSRTLLQSCVFYLVPNMNPDGAINGNLRTNVRGANLNREWLTPSLENSPEVFFVRQKMLETGCDMFFDIHGDEALAYVFTAGCEDNPSFSKKQEELSNGFIQAFLQVNPDYQTKHGYDKGHFNEQTPTLATNWVGNAFDCLALTLEMPFKDNANLPSPEYGWNGSRSYLLGESMLSAIHASL